MDTNIVSDVEYSDSDTNRWTCLNGFGIEYGHKIPLLITAVATTEAATVVWCVSPAIMGIGGYVLVSLPWVLGIEAFVRRHELARS